MLLIDEVLSVGDESFQRKSAERIEQFRREGRTIVFVSHGLASVEQLCEQVAWIEKGELDASRIGFIEAARDSINRVSVVDKNNLPLTIEKPGYNHFGR